MSPVNRCALSQEEAFHNQAENNKTETGRSFSKDELRSLTKEKLHEHMGRLSVREREHQANVVAGVCEVDRRRLYFDYGFTSLFDYMTKGREFPNASAQRYIDAARLCMIVPTLNEDIAKGEVNLSQVTIVSRTVRQKMKEEPKFKMEARQATALFDMIKGEDGRSSQRIIAQELKVEIKDREVARVQADGSARHEVTFNKEQEENYQRVRELLSHIFPNPGLNEVFDYLATEYRKRKDPLVAEGRATKNSTSVEVRTSNDRDRESQDRAHPKTNEKNDFPFHLEVNGVQSRRAAHFDESSTIGHFQTEADDPLQSQIELESDPTSNNGNTCAIPAKRTYISVQTRRLVHRRDRSCRYIHRETGEVCGSKFQLEPDHVQPLWAGGTNEPENLRLMCGAHNRWKYRNEAQLRWV